MSRRTLPLGQVIAPPLAEVRATSREIVGDSTKRVLRKAAPDLLDRFCHIAESDDIDAAVEAFARRWGMLGLCAEHGLPYRHGPIDVGPAVGIELRRLARKYPRWKEVQINVSEIQDNGEEVHVDLYETDWTYCEPGVTESFDGWKNLAHRFGSMLRIALDLKQGEFGRRDGWKTDWELAATENGMVVPVSSPSNIAEARHDYSFLVDRLIRMSGLQPSFYWTGGVWNIEMDSGAGYSNLPAILTAQLMLKVASAETLIKCSECPRWFIPRRNQRKYCNHCGKRAMWRVAQRKRKGKIDEQKKTRKR